MQLVVSRGMTHFAAVVLREHEDYGNKRYTGGSTTMRRIEAYSIGLLGQL